MTIDVPIRLPTFEEGFSPDPGGVGILIDPIPELWDRISIVFARGGNKQTGRGRTKGKEGATDIPSWAKGTVPRIGESGKDYAKRLMDEKYGRGNYDTGPGSEYNKLKKYGDRHFRTR